MVSDGEGRVVKTADQARTQPSLTLAFVDGKLEVAPAGARQKPRKPAPGGTGGQAELF